MQYMIKRHIGSRHFTVCTGLSKLQQNKSSFAVVDKQWNMLTITSKKACWPCRWQIWHMVHVCREWVKKQPLLCLLCSCCVLLLFMYLTHWCLVSHKFICEQGWHWLRLCLRWQAVNKPIVDLLSVKTTKINILKFSFKKMYLKNDVCKMVSILFMTQCIVE